MTGPVPPSGVVAGLLPLRQPQEPERDGWHRRFRAIEHQPEYERITLIGTIAPEYDAAGNLTKDDQWRYVYDAENRIVEVRTLPGATIATYSYDWRGVRLKKVVGGSTTRYVFSGLKALAEYTNGTLTREYVYHGDRLLGEWAAGTPQMRYGD